MDVPFESFAKLIYRLGHPPQSSSGGDSNARGSALPPSRIFSSWLAHLPRPLPIHTGKHLFRLLFPHEGSRRRYGLKETKLASELEKVLGVEGLVRWDCVNWDAGSEAGTGCLGREVELSLRDRPSSSAQSRLSIREVDKLLDELASASPFSQLSQLPYPVRSTSNILRILYRDSSLSPYALSVLTQIILRDLRPLTSPLPRLRIRNPTAMLRLKSTAGPDQLSLQQAMKCWHPKMWQLHVGGLGDIDDCADEVERLGKDDNDLDFSPAPVVGVNVKIPKCRKGRSVADVLSEFTGTRYAPSAKEVWAETKYDGYRLQIHVTTHPTGQPRITVFSKSTRDSTADRLNCHSIILGSLGLPIPEHLPMHSALRERLLTSYRPGRAISSVILEAEVVPYNESSREGGRSRGIEEFWWLGLAGVSTNSFGGDLRSSSTGLSKPRSRHLCLVFFDVLLVDDQNLLHATYEARRTILEQTIRPIDGFAMLAERTRISLGLDRRTAIKTLQETFQRSNTAREEGLVLKASDSTYASMRWQWVKLKKDYIPELGDCVDLVMLGAGWDIDRARELRVDTSVFTTFYIGVLTNSDQVKAKREVPNFEVLFRASYGLDRTQLEVVNGNIRHGRWASKPYDKDDPFKRRLLGLSWTCSLPRGMTPPSVLLVRPMCVEVMGAGFQRLPGSELYELRWPRLQKWYDPTERSWTDALSAQELLHVAHTSLGYHAPPSPKSSDDSVKAAWRSSSTLALVDVADLLVSPKDRSPRLKRNRSEADLDFEREKGSLWTDRSPKTSAARGRPPAASAAAWRLRQLMSDDEGVDWGADATGHIGLQEPLRLSPERRDLPSKRNTTEPPRPPGASPQPLVPCSPPVEPDPGARPTPRRIESSGPSPAKKLIRAIEWSLADLTVQTESFGQLADSLRQLSGSSGPAESHPTSARLIRRPASKSALLSSKCGYRDRTRPLSLRSRIKIASRGIRVAE
ncbi:hypothetical protein IAU60_005235 [Kwoniella sp. DSM 27419]